MCEVVYEYLIGAPRESDWLVLVAMLLPAHAVLGRIQEDQEKKYNFESGALVYLLFCTSVRGCRLQ